MKDKKNKHLDAFLDAPKSDLEIEESKKLPIPVENLPRTEDSFSRYMTEINRYPLLTREEEQKLAHKLFDKKDLIAAQKLVTSNLRFVVKIAFEYSRYGMKMMDLIQEGNVGLLRAVKEFNPYKNVRLITYAVWWIRSYIQEYILKNWSLVKIGTTHDQKKLFYNLKREKERLLKEGLTSVDQKLLSDNLGVSEKDIVEMSMRLAHKDASLNVPVDEDSGVELISQIADTHESFVDTLSHEENLKLFRDQLEKFSKTLNEKELYILENRLLTENPLTLQEIGNHYRITKERARQLEERVKKKLQEYLKKNAPDLE